MASIPNEIKHLKLIRYGIFQELDEINDGTDQEVSRIANFPSFKNSSDLINSMKENVKISSFNKVFDMDFNSFISHISFPDIGKFSHTLSKQDQDNIIKEFSPLPLFSAFASSDKIMNISNNWFINQSKAPPIQLSRRKLVSDSHSRTDFFSFFEYKRIPVQTAREHKRFNNSLRRFRSYLWNSDLSD